MKLKVLLVIGMAVVAACLSAYIFLPRQDIADADNNKVSIVYDAEKNAEEKINITLNLDIDCNSFEIGRDITVSLDDRFRECLKPEELKIEDNRIEYTFDKIEGTDEVYIKPPVLYIPSRIEVVRVGTCVGEVASIGDEKWFSIASIGVKNNIVHILIIPEKQEFPRLPKLVINGTRIGCVTSMNLNEDNIFDFGEMIFQIPDVCSEDIVSDLKNSFLEISDAIKIVKSPKVQYFSDAVQLQLID